MFLHMLFLENDSKVGKDNYTAMLCNYFGDPMQKKGQF